MKKYSILFFTVIFSLLLASCNYGWSEFFDRGYEVNERATGILDLDALSLGPSVGDSERYSVILFTDIHTGVPKDSDYEDFKIWVMMNSSILAQMGYPVKFMISLGDLTNTGSTEEYDEFNTFCASMEKEMGFKTYAVVGNHDLYNSGWKYYQNRIFPHTSCYSFTTSVGGRNLSWYFFDTASGSFGEPQVKAMKARMKNDPNDKLVFTHYPLFGNGFPYYTLQNLDERDMVVSLFAKNRVKKVFNGHTHVQLESDFGDYFTEHTLGSFVKNKKCAILRVDQSLGVYSVVYKDF